MSVGFEKVPTYCAERVKNNSNSGDEMEKK